MTNALTGKEPQVLSPGPYAGGRSSLARVRLWLTLALLSANVIMFALAVGMVMENRDHLLERVELSTRNTAALLAQGVSDKARIFEDALGRVSHELESQLANGRRNDLAINRFLQFQLSQLPEVYAIHAMDEEGFVRWGRDVNPEKPANSSDRDYYKQHRDDPVSRLIVTPPLLGRVSGRWVTSFTRPYRYPDGRFAGVIMVSATVDGFADLLSRADTGKSGTVVLRHANIGLIARHPPIAGPAGLPGHDKVSPEFKAVLDSGVTAATFHTPASPDSVERTYSFRRIANPPFTIAAGMARDEYLAPWREEVRRVGLLLGAFLLTTLAAAWVILRYWQNRWQAEQTLQRSEEDLRRAQSVALVGSWHFDIPSGAIRWSEETYRIFGLPAGSPITLDRYFACVHPDDANGVRIAWNAALHGEPFDKEHRIIVGTETRWVHERAQLESGPDGRVREGIGTAQDITVRKLAEAKASKATQLLEDAIGSIAQGFTIYDMNDRLVICNEAYRQIYSTSRDLIVPGASFEEIVRKGAERGQYPDAIGRVDEWVKERVWQHQHADGTPIEQHLDDGRWLLIVESRTTHGYIVGNRIDISDRKAAEAELQLHRHNLEALVRERTAELALARDAAEAANRAKSLFLANMSHELRTPLNQIAGMASLVRREGLSPSQGDRMAKLDLAVGKLTRVLGSILEMTRIESGRPDLVDAPVDVVALIQEVTGDLSDAARAKNLPLLAEPESMPGILRGDAGHIRIALTNYVDNAIRFTASGAICLRAKLCEENPDDVLIRFEVEDTGCGIAAEDMPRLFAIFEQGDNSATREHGGIGLGLATTQKLARLMGGDAGCESWPGKGSLFWFTVRLKKTPAL
jgi:signal transduction histidine kinase